MTELPKIKGTYNSSCKQLLIANTFEMVVGNKGEGNNEDIYCLIDGYDKNGKCNAYVYIFPSVFSSSRKERFYKLINYDFNNMTWEKAQKITKPTYTRNFKKFYNDAKKHVKFCKAWELDPFKYSPTIC